MSIITDVHNEAFYEWFSDQPTLSRGRGRRKKRDSDFEYKDIVSAFDIETTRIASIEQSIMYIWQWQFEEEYTIIGRTWNELNEFMYRLEDLMQDDERLCIYVHNLSYEFQFLRAIIPWTQEEVFAVDSRKILKATHENFEFRCSYLHSNMSLGTYLDKMGTKHRKLDGDEFNYDKPRYPWTPISDKELEYCVNDVLGLVEALKIEMEHDGDNLYTIPLTSTGYVRRDVKRAMADVGKNYIERLLPDYDTFKALREAFRGGNTHANRYFAGWEIDNVSSADRSSSYPDVQINCRFPVSKFVYIGKQDAESLQHLIFARNKAVLMRICISNVRLTDEDWGCPYLAKDKCRNIVNGKYDNGRILSAEYLETTLTDIDYRILLDEYDFDNFMAIDVWHARYGPLPEQLKDVIRNYYTLKTELKGVKGKELLYTKSKNKLNSIYGMSAQNPAKQSYNYVGGIDPFVLDETPIEDLLDEANGKAFFSYAWGVWTTAWARYRLEEGIRLAGKNFVYCDTDSVKYVGEIDWTEYNKQREEDSRRNHAYATDPSGVTHYMGVYEFEGKYDTFKTLGAKKYCYIKDGKLDLTLAGVSKDVWAKDKDGKKYLKKVGGAAELMKHGGIEAFEEGFVFKESGGTDLLYNDEEYGEFKVDGHTLWIYPNVVIKQGFYTLGITLEYAQLIEGLVTGTFYL